MLYILGIVGAFVAAIVLRKTVTKGASSGFMMEMPKYQLPRLRDVAIGLWSRAYAFLRRAGTIILASTVVLWLLLSYPKPPVGSTITPVDYSIAGRIANGLAVVTKPRVRGQGLRERPRRWYAPCSRSPTGTLHQGAAVPTLPLCPP